MRAGGQETGLIPGPHSELCGNMATGTRHRMISDTCPGQPLSPKPDGVERSPIKWLKLDGGPGRDKQ
jgi:hypothetical protein